MFRFKLLRWSRKIHKWIGIYIGFVVILWLFEMICLPKFSNPPGMPVVDGSLSNYSSLKKNPMTSKEALTVFINSHPKGLKDIKELSEISYFPSRNIYRFSCKRRFLEWYMDASTGKIVKYGFVSNRFLEQKGMLGWIHPLLGKIIKYPFYLLFILLSLTGQGTVSKKKDTLLDMSPGEKRYIRSINTEPDIARRLIGMGLLPGVAVRMVRIRKRGPVLISVQHTYLGLGRDIAKHILTEER
ncbi:ferrous iron transport protein A [Candidatus Aerophobetes bacterium]|nr:ferrous iron transport protein A [Candidatus Aerophobetes bacterium]